MAHDFSENIFIDWKLFVGGNYRGPWGEHLLSFPQIPLSCSRSELSSLDEKGNEML